MGSTRPLSGLQLRPGPASVDARLKAVGDKVEIRPIMYLALSYDHRVVDCREAVTFRSRKHGLRDPLPANRALQDKIGYLLNRPVGRPPHEMRRYYASFRYQAHS